LQNQKAKKMPSEHRITGMNEGDMKFIQNDHGEFALIRLAKLPGDYGYDFISEEKTLDDFKIFIESHNESMQDAINDKTQDYINDNLTGG